MFSAKSKMNLPTGTIIKNKANITFDVNPPMETPEVFNTIDSDAPSSFVDALPDVASLSDFELHWNGTDGMALALMIIPYTFQ